MSSINAGTYSSITIRMAHSMVSLVVIAGEHLEIILQMFQMLFLLQTTALFKRDASSDISLVVAGTVNTIQHNRTLPQGFSLVSYPFPVDTTLDDSGIYSGSNGYVSGGDANSSDIVYIISSGSYTSCYRQDDPFDGFFGGDGWRALGDNSTDVGSTIPVGSAIIIKHTGSPVIGQMPHHTFVILID